MGLSNQYRETSQGPAVPVARLAYLPFRLPGGTESLRLSARAIGGKTGAVGVRDGKIFECQ